jgi:hemerythrin-like metal-binding protein
MVRTAPDGGDAPLANLVWRRSYQCGDAIIDKEHKDLFMHGNTLIRAVANGRIPLDKLPEMLDELIESVMAHFRNEEFILSRYGYAELESHAYKHRKLIERALELRSMAVSGELSLAEVVSFVTRDVVAVHMLVDDHGNFPLLRKASQRNPLELP